MLLKKYTVHMYLQYMCTQSPPDLRNISLQSTAI
jgi:hypothetical protein